MTTSSQTLSQHLQVLANPGSHQAGLVEGVRRSVASWLCRLHGHAPQLQMERDRLFLYCSHCQLESPGWSLAGATPRVRQPGAADRHVRYAWLPLAASLQLQAADGELVVY